MYSFAFMFYRLCGNATMTKFHNNILNGNILRGNHPQSLTPPAENNEARVIISGWAHVTVPAAITLILHRREKKEREDCFWISCVRKLFFWICARRILVCGKTDVKILKNIIEATHFIWVDKTLNETHKKAYSLYFHFQTHSFVILFLIVHF